MCGLSLKTMYRTRDASSTRQKDYTSLLQKHGFRTGQAWPCIFLHEERSKRLLVHGDDSLVLADEEGHAFVDRVLRERYEFKCDGHIGPGQTEQSMPVLKRKGKVSLTVESDSSAARGMTQRQGLAQTRHVETRYLCVQEKIQRKHSLWRK